MITTLLAVNWLEVKACEARLNQRIDELRADLKDNMKELRADNRALGEKLDRVLEALLTAKQA